MTIIHRILLSGYWFQLKIRTTSQKSIHSMRPLGFHPDKLTTGEKNFSNLTGGLVYTEREHDAAAA
jgi:hypothetical protein